MGASDRLPSTLSVTWHSLDTALPYRRSWKAPWRKLENTVNSLRDLLVRQVELTGGLITQKKEGRAKDTEEQVRRLNENADRIAELLAFATPEYEESVLKEMFRMYVDLTGQEISERPAGNYEKDLQTFWNIQRQIIAMADYFANGLETEAKESGLR